MEPGSMDHLSGWGRLKFFFKKESKGEMNNKHYGWHQPTEISQTRFGGVDR